MTTEPTPRVLADALVDAGLVEQARRGEAEQVLGNALAPAVPGAESPLRRRMAEVAGYVGGAFVVGAAVLFFANQWGNLTRGGQIAVLSGIALLLAAAALVLTATGGGRGALRAEAEAVRRRLTSVLSVGAALATGFAVGLAVQDPAVHSDDSRGVLAGAGAALLVALGGYLLAPSVVGQLAMAVAAFLMVPAVLDTGGDVSGTAMGLIVLAIGLVWLTLAELRVWHEDLAGRLIGCTLVLIGAQMPVFEDPQWLGYTLTALVAAAAFTGYVVRQAWPYLATGVVAATLAVPEALTDWMPGSIGSAGALLLAGVTLLVAALAGLRLRHGAGGPHPHHP
jgi:hypothetical protein